MEMLLKCISVLWGVVTVVTFSFKVYWCKDILYISTPVCVNIHMNSIYVCVCIYEIGRAHV